MPLSESTMARSGPAASSAANEAATASPSARAPKPSRMAPQPSFGLRPAAASVSPQVANVFGKKARTTWPKMIGSETFIIVAFRCTEKSTPSSLARAIWASRKVRRSATRITAASTTSPARTAMGGRSSLTVPSAATSSTDRLESAAITADCSVERKSPEDMWATLVRDSGDQAPMRWGCVRA